MLILEFTTQTEATNCLATINAMAADYWTAQGYTVDNGELIGKRASDHVDQADKTRTVAWDVVRESPDATFYFSSLTGTPYVGAMDDLAADFTFTEREFPIAWYPEDEY